MKFDDYLRMFPIDAQRITSEQAAACRYLERNGQRFLVDFGYQNAAEKVWAEFDAEIETIQ